MVVTISPSFSLYRMVVLPAASRPTWARRTAERSAAAERRLGLRGVRPPDALLPAGAHGARGAGARRRARSSAARHPREEEAEAAGGPSREDSGLLVGTKPSGRALLRRASGARQASKQARPGRRRGQPAAGAAQRRRRQPGRSVPHHEDAHLLLGEELGEQLRKREPLRARQLRQARTERKQLRQARTISSKSTGGGGRETVSSPPDVPIDPSCMCPSSRACAASGVREAAPRQPRRWPPAPVLETPCFARAVTAPHAGRGPGGAYGHTSSPGTAPTTTWPRTGTARVAGRTTFMTARSDAGSPLR
jgi:hypothetical protein